MTDRLIVCFRFPELFIEPEAYLASAKNLGERAAALGGELASWGATVFAFEFDLESIQDAIDWVLSIVRDASTPMSVGISQGTLASTVEGGGKRILKWGVPLVHATALARAARPGEVLLDPTLGALQRGEILTTGSRVGVYGRLRLRGSLLDLQYPWCAQLAERAQMLVRPERIGRNELDELTVDSGSVVVLRAPHGAGGSRALDEIEERSRPAPVLRITPHPVGEPLGGLRRAVRTAKLLEQKVRTRSEHFAGSVDALIGGEGLDLDSCAELLVEIIAPNPHDEEIGIVTVDDAGEVDADTLEVLARALSLRPDTLSVVLRLTEAEPVPPAFDQAPRGLDLTLKPLAVEHAAEVAQACLKGELDDRSATRWGNRGGRLPLGVVEAVRDGIETGEIVWETGHASARLRSAGAGDRRSPRHWVKRRLERLDAGSLRVLEALSVLGGQAERGELEAVIRKRDDLFIDIKGSLAVLTARGFLLRAEPDLLRLPSATHRDAILSTFSESDFRSWHLAACDACDPTERPLATAAATVHALLAGETSRARELARTTAASTRALGLEETAAAFLELANSGDAGALSRRHLYLASLELPRAVPSLVVASRAEPASEGGSERREDVAPEESAAEAASPISEVDEDDIDVTVEVEEPVAEALLDAADSSGAAVRALRKGDADTVERMAAELRMTDRGGVLAERLSAMAKLARGETGDAIRRLREAADRAKATSSRDRCRTALALGVALAAGGRHEEALLEALYALARARETEDGKGEQACLRFLAHLSATAGHAQEAAVWASAVQSG